MELHYNELLIVFFFVIVKYYSVFSCLVKNFMKTENIQETWKWTVNYKLPKRN